MATYTIDQTKMLGTYSGAAIAGEVIDAGMWLYQDAATKKVYKALNDSAAHAKVIGIAINGSAKAGQPILYQSAGECVLDMTETGAGVFTNKGQHLVLSGTAGKMMDAGDAAPGTTYPTYLGYSTSKYRMVIEIVYPGIVYGTA